MRQDKNDHTNYSEVAQLRQQIESEYRAACEGLHGLAMRARHDFIQARMQRVEEYYQELSSIVGPEAAITTVIKINDAFAGTQRKQEPQP
ncbi:hypothetical protein EPA93_01690 [Ktedonosporobacter rubrisoli]|uniref:Uncharacterized protein n=1 Tax=Ktedonosporobacter rubrisoli TaxID=2509675 RepID=A0A4P6JIM9_KTERU|nr:hypothetical protein [Ktedonosporobacter rubrisoli]QBD74772.1 hypothetical protein EPA93_01690 [Ktedonosporobacter rubrisoli]